MTDTNENIAEENLEMNEVSDEGLENNEENEGSSDTNELEKAQEEALLYKDKYMRSVAEMENLKRRHEKQKADAIKFGLESLMKNLLPVLDGFDKSSEVSSETVLEDYQKGIEMVRKQLVDVLAKSGLEGFDSKGEPFNPEFHQAIQKIEDPEVSEELVKDEYQKGYKLNDRLLRAAMVSVAVPSEG